MGSRLRYCDTARTAATPHVASAEPARNGDSPAPNPLSRELKEWRLASTGRWYETGPDITAPDEMSSGACV